MNQAVVLEAPAQIGPGGTAVTLSSWSDGDAATHTIHAPATGGTYTAVFHANAASPQRTATASTIENGLYAASNAIDGDPGTRWSSAFADPQWLAVDLGEVMDITRVALHWETAHARAYAIQVSGDGKSWTTVHATTAGDGGFLAEVLDHEVIPVVTFLVPKDDEVIWAWAPSGVRAPP